MGDLALQLGPVRVDLVNRRVVHPDRTVVLSPLETSLLTYMLGRRGANASREELLVQVWGYSPRVVTRAVDHTVSRLRKKLEVDPAEPRWLVSTRGGGYRLELAPDDVPVRLPAERDRFVGRAGELDELAARFEDGARLVTVLGPGGVGKTRLAHRFAAGRASRHPGGTWFCDLSDARDAFGIALDAARRIGASSSDPVDGVVRALERRGPCLLVLDNFEPVAAHAEPTVGRWLEACPELRIVVTSRVRLGVPGERALTLDPLPADDAVELFLARATASGWAPSPADSAAIVELVSALDRLPLAIELAAARIGVLSPRGLLARMTDPLTVLRDPSPRSERHASVQHTLDASWDLLGPEEQAALARLSVFDGAAPLSAVEGVIGVEGALDVVQRLVDHSLVRVAAPEQLGVLSLVRDYGRRRLGERGERDKVERRHGEWFARYGEDASLARIDGPGGAAVAAELDAALPNLVAACERAVARGDAGVAGRTARAIWRVMLRSGSAAAAARWLEAALALPGHDDSTLTVLRMDAGWARRIASDHDRAAEHYEAAAALAERAGERRLLGRILRAQGDAARLQRRSGVARPLYERALSVARATDDRLAEAVAVMSLGVVALEEVRLDDARRLLFDALELHRALGNHRSEGVTLGNLGLVAAMAGDFDQAVALLGEARAIHASFGNVGAEARARLNLALVEVARGRLDGVAEALDEAERTLVLQGDTYHVAEVRTARGELLLARGELPAAQRAYEAGLAGHRASGNGVGCALALAGLGVVRAARGDPSGGRVRLVEALAWVEPLDDQRTTGLVCTLLAEIDLDLHGPTHAEPTLARAEQCFASRGDPSWVAIARCVRSRLALRVGDAARAEVERREAEVVARRLGVGPQSELGRRLKALRVPALG